MAALLSSTLCSQTLVEFSSSGTRYIGVPVQTWEAIVARRLDANELNRSRARTIVLMRADVADADSVASTYRLDAAEYRDREARAIWERDQVAERLAKSERKVLRLRPWATVMKVQVCVAVVAGTVYVVQSLRP